MKVKGGMENVSACKIFYQCSLSYQSSNKQCLVSAKPLLQMEFCHSLFDNHGLR